MVSPDFPPLQNLYGSPHGVEGFAGSDSYTHWDGITIPVVMVPRARGDFFRSLMHLESMDIPGLGVQWMDFDGGR